MAEWCVKVAATLYHPAGFAGMAMCLLLHSDIVSADGLADAPDVTAVEFFEKQVRPILVDHCQECHCAADVNGGLRLDSGPAVRSGGDSGPAVVPGDPESSNLILAVRYRNPDLQMPPKGRLTEDQISVLEKWVTIGVPDPRTESPNPPDRPTGMSIEDGRRFWSFQPLQEVEIPRVGTGESVFEASSDLNLEPAEKVALANRLVHPIDAFLQVELNKHALKPAIRTDRRTLIRRITFDLTGLPPTPEEVSAFLADESEDAFSRVTERLLASPQYGVRWGRHWLDVARYADSNGLDENIAFGNAWRYRDYVVDAFNSDKPFDRFLIEQIAGDLLPSANQETRTATGFLVLGAKVLAEPDMEKLVMDTVDEQLDTVGKAFMAVTLGCVRCHDHKFDPLKQTDYYAMAAIFKSTKTFSGTNTGAIKYWNEHSFATEADLAEIKKIDAELAGKKSAAATFKNKAMAKVRADAQARAADYLQAATLFAPSASLTVVDEIAASAKLHSRILHHCRLHLDYHKDDPFFRTWHQFVSSGKPDRVFDYYSRLFSQATDPTQGDHRNSFTSSQLEQARQAIDDASGFLAVPPKVDYAFDAETLSEYFRLEDVARIAESEAADEPAAMGVGEEATITSLPIHIRGSHLNLGVPVSREFPEVMRTSSQRPVLPENQSGRLQLAQWMASRQHPLTARVIVNRVWAWHFGRGLVGTTENFGKTGERPSHPELLDWITRHFIETGWSVKELHRLILSSNAYQMSSRHAGADTASVRDPENRLMYKFRMQRLTAEQLRDAILFISGRLDLSLGGKTVPLRNRQFVFNHTSEDHTKYDSLRRSIYLPVIRNNIYTFFEQFDFPDPTMPTGQRSSTIVAPQALLLMNADLVMDSATELAMLLETAANNDIDRISFAYQKVLGRPATGSELKRAARFIGEMTAEDISSGGTHEFDHQQAWSAFCQSLFASNEFMYVK